MCLREQGVLEKYERLVKDAYEDARTQVNTSIGVSVTSKIAVRVGLYQGSSLFDIILDMIGRCINGHPSLVAAVCIRYSDV